ncbi:Oidioi.mRNA.OKI2018_I69.XSR.g14028.t1.cds [Oikopleura dioica]|uniref:Oidioi.mRNA.OKI2018_I69.XSR.g14028.t1.cds n=1 Tax=Oikopleura dioica TaxID=34765 RepID=A0ABN7SFV1_OIKDI|nr:Oidioi.mRNA.OKI2018_I69.XSR.g14028.t1.cds [Oikopleura dioica]
MTDLCQEKDAQSNCEAAVKMSLQEDSTNAGAFIVATSFLISSSKFDEAKKMLSDGKKLWYEKYEDFIYEKVEVPEENRIDSEKRMNACRYAIELEMWDDALQIARQVAEEEVEDCETRYFLAYGLFRRWKEMVEDKNFTNQEEINDYKRDCYEEANETLRLAEEAVKKREQGAREIQEEVRQMLEDLGPPPEPEAEDQMDDENEEEWETDEEMNE